MYKIENALISLALYKLFICVFSGIDHPSMKMMRSSLENTGRISLSTHPFMVRTSQVLWQILIRMFGMSAVWEPFWIVLVKNMEFRSKESTQLTCTLVCGRPHSHGILKIWTCTASIICTSGPPSIGLPSHLNMVEDWKGWLQVNSTSYILQLHTIRAIWF